MYRAGMFNVLTETADGQFHRSRFFETEQEARTYGNTQWKKASVISVEIYKTGFYKKRRHSVLVASATKKGE